MQTYNTFIEFIFFSTFKSLKLYKLFNLVYRNVLNILTSQTKSTLLTKSRIFVAVSKSGSRYFYSFIKRMSSKQLLLIHFHPVVPGMKQSSLTPGGLSLEGGCWYITVPFISVRSVCIKQVVTISHIIKMCHFVLSQWCVGYGNPI